MSVGRKEKGVMRTARRVTEAVMVCAALVAPLLAQAQANYPNRPIRLITPAAPGGTTDILARLFGARMSETFKQQVVVDNRASASGVNAAEIVARAPADGYTLFLPFVQHTVNAALNPNLPYKVVDDFTPISQLTAGGMMLLVPVSSPVKNLKEFIEWSKSYKGALNYGSAGLGSGGHLAGELYNQMAGIKAQHIPYKGAGPAMIDLVGGQYQFGFAGLQGSQVQVRAGKLRALAVTTPKRIAVMPDVPTMAEVLPGFDVMGWYGVLGPARLPNDIVAKLHDELVRILALPDVRERILADGSEPVGSTPEAFRKYLLADAAKWAKLIKPE
jgi:tripartite-type tricarboxylate transporter receptor subunit TctC